MTSRRVSRQPSRHSRKYRATSPPIEWPTRMSLASGDSCRHSHSQRSVCSLSRRAATRLSRRQSYGNAKKFLPGVTANCRCRYPDSLEYPSIFHSPGIRCRSGTIIGAVTPSSASPSRNSRSARLRPRVTSARAAAPAVGAHTSRPRLSRSTLPVMPGNSTTTSAIGRIIAPRVETNRSLPLRANDFKTARYSSRLGPGPLSPRAGCVLNFDADNSASPSLDLGLEWRGGRSSGTGGGEHGTMHTPKSQRLQRRYLPHVRADYDGAVGPAAQAHRRR